MNVYRPSCAVAVALIATQVFGPAVLWAADQRGIQIEETRRVVVAAISGEQLTVQRGGDTKALHFREAVNAGDQIETGDRTVADVLIGNRAVVTLGQSTTVQFTTVRDEQTIIQLKRGLVRVAAAASALGDQGIVTVQTPTGQVQTRGGIVRVLVDQPAGAAEHRPIGEARSYRASYSSNPTTVVAALTPGSEIIQVEEGSAEIAGAGGKAITVQAGQAVTMQGGQAGPISKLVNQADMRAGVLASAGHNQTPKEGRDHLVALQVEQATALGTALTGAAETGKGEVARKDHLKNVINGATGGVLLNSGSLVSSLFGGGNTANPTASTPQDRTGNGFGGTNSNGSFGVSGIQTSVFLTNPSALLSFTRKDPVEERLENDGVFHPLESVASDFVVAKELILIGGASNDAHGGIPPLERLIIRGLAKEGLFGPSLVTNKDFTPTDRAPSVKDGIPANDMIVAANNTFVVEKQENFSSQVVEKIPDGQGGEVEITRFVGGTLGQYSSSPDKRGLAFEGFFFPPASLVDGAITATTATDRPPLVLSGGVSLDQGTIATIGTTDTTKNYFVGLPDTLGGKFSGSLLSIINGPNKDVTTSVTMQDRMLGVYDGSQIDIEGSNKALLSVLDAKLKGPTASSSSAPSIPLIDIAAGSHATRNYVLDNDGNIVLTPDKEGNQNLTFKDEIGPGLVPNVTVTSALVVRSTIELDGPIQLDRALLEASAPLFALTKANMTTTSHFADLAGNKVQSMLLNDSLVVLNASTLTIKGNLLNLQEATATVKGYLFSLTDGSTLTLNEGALFSLTKESSLNLAANAFGVFGGVGNILTIDNNLCTATCFQLVNSANQPILLDGTPLQVAGVTHNVMLPEDFKVFALVPGAPVPDVNIGENAALFHIDGTSTLTINGTTVVGPLPVE